MGKKQLKFKRCMVKERHTRGGIYLLTPFSVRLAFLSRTVTKKIQRYIIAAMK